MLAIGPTEPDSTRLARYYYYLRRGWLDDLEQRITSTEAGMLWLYRVKRIGHA